MSLPEVCSCGRIAVAQVNVDSEMGSVTHPPECTFHALDTAKIGAKAYSRSRYSIAWFWCEHCGGEGYDEGAVCRVCAARTERGGERYPTPCSNVPLKSEKEELHFGDIIHHSWAHIEGGTPELVCWQEIMVVAKKPRAEDGYTGLLLGTNRDAREYSLGSVPPAAMMGVSLGGSGYHIASRVEEWNA